MSLVNRLKVEVAELKQAKANLENEIDDVNYQLKTEKRAKEKLSEKLDRYLDEVKRAETEKDEMREVVSLLVDKGACFLTP